MTMFVRSAAFALSVMAMATACVAQAQDARNWPERSISLIVPFGTGSTPDVLARLVADKLSTMYSHPVVVQNRGGASGAIAMEAVRQSKPDGYTLFTSALGGTVILPAVNKNIPYKPNDFTHIAFLGGPPSVVIVHKDFPAKTLQDLIAATKPPKPVLTYGVSGFGTHTHLVGELFQKRVGIKMQAVAYRGGAQSTVDLLGGHIPIGSIPLVSVSEHIRSGALRALAVTSPQRPQGFPDLPTFAELGFPELTATTWFSISAAPGTPKAIAEKLNADIRKALKAPDVVDFYKRENIVVSDLDLDAFNAFFRDEVKKWHGVVAEAGIKLE
jgi:tripartite-type tricarboxylate transporter receptor subunit TctC